VLLNLQDCVVCLGKGVLLWVVPFFRWLLECWGAGFCSGVINFFVELLIITSFCCGAVCEQKLFDTRLQTVCPLSVRVLIIGHA